MFNLLNRDKVSTPAILLCAVGDAPAIASDKAIYQPYANITEFKADTFSDLDTFLRGKTFDIVHLFVIFAADGTVDGQAGIEVLQLLTRASAKLAIFACDNAFENYRAAFPSEQRKGIDNMHLVFTIDRKDDNFLRFFRGVFDLMARGKSMPVAWVTLAPQHDGPWMEKMPECMFEARRGQLKFVP